MPPVAIGVAIAAGAAAAAAGATIAAAVAIASIAFSVMVALTTKVPSFDGYSSAQERKQVLRSAAASKLGVYGDVIGSGVLFFAEEQAGDQTDGELLHMCIAIAGHKLNSIGEIYLNDDPISNYGEYATYTFHNDRSTVDQNLLANCKSWDADMIGKGIAFIHFVFKFNAEKFPTSIPNIKIKKRGFSVYDPRDGQTKFSSNSALVYLHFLRNFCDVKDQDILFDQFISSANICDELVETPEGTTPRYQTNGEFDFSESRIKVLEAILESCAGTRVYTGGKHGLMVGAYSGPATMEIHSKQVCGDIRITPETAERDRFNTYKGTFISAKQNFTQCDFPQVSVPEWVQEDGGIISKDIDYRFITNEYQAQRISRLKLNRSRKGRILTIPMNYSGFAYRPGLNVKVYFPELGIDGVEFRIDSWGFSVANAVTITMIQDDVSMYGDILGSPVTVPPLTTLPSGGPAAPENFAYISEPVGEVVQGKLIWTNKGTQIADNVVTVLKGGVVQLMANAPGQELPLNGLVSGNYEARIFSVAVNGARSPIVTLAFTIAVPPIPSSVKVIADNWSIQLIPEFTDPVAFGTICEFYTSTVELPITEVVEKAFYLGMGTTLIHSGLRPDTMYYYWIRSVNAYGKSAFLAMNATTTYDIDSILDALDGEIGAEHLREELRKPIESIKDIALEVEGLKEGITEISEVLEDGSLAKTLDALKVSAESAAGGALSAALANAESDQERRSNVGVLTVRQEVLATEQEVQGTRIVTLGAQVDDNHAAILQESSVRATADRANATYISQVEAKVGQNTAAVQTVSQAVATVNGEVHAGWYTKAQVNGLGGGFGLSVEMKPDGTALTSFVIDADVFAILTRTAQGATSKRHPFVVKNNIVYIDSAMIDRAEVGTLISEYIKVTTVDAATITNSVLKGNAAAFGAGGPYPAFGQTWHTVISSDGQIKTNRLIAEGVYVDTLNIKQNAITIPVFKNVSVDVQISAGASPTSVGCITGTVDFNTAASCAILLNSIVEGGGYTNCTMYATVRNGSGTIVWEWSESESVGDGNSFSPTMFTNVELPAGSYTFELRFGNTWSSGSYRLRKASLLMIGIKR